MTMATVLQSEVEQALRLSPIPALRLLQVAETETEIVLHGSVSSYYLKQLAQETVMPYRGCRRLYNQVNVNR